jgi:hypothetical protein
MPIRLIPESALELEPELERLHHYLATTRSPIFS